MTSTMFDLSGRHAVVTGGGSGIGLAIARALTAHGASVSLWGRRGDLLAASAADLGTTATHRVVDVTDEDAVVRAMAEEAALTDLRAVVLAAGVNGTPVPFLSSTREDLEATMRTNTVGTYLTMREAGRHLVAAGGGSIVSISSLAAVQGASRHQAYAASKAAATALANGAAVELARHGVRVNSILPGWIATDMSHDAQQSATFTERVVSRVPLRRWGRPDEIAGAAVYLASDASTYQTGSAVVIDGGYGMF